MLASENFDEEADLRISFPAAYKIGINSPEVTEPPMVRVFVLESSLICEKRLRSISIPLLRAPSEVE
jgi:hypothetical protein